MGYVVLLFCPLAIWSTLRSLEIHPCSLASITSPGLLSFLYSYHSWKCLYIKQHINNIVIFWKGWVSLFIMSFSQNASLKHILKIFGTLSLHTIVLRNTIYKRIIVKGKIKLGRYIV